MVRAYRQTLLSIAALALAAPALAQPPGVLASPPVPDTAQESPGIPGPDAVNPAPGATGPYVGAGRQGFYDIDQRIARIGSRIASLPPGERRAASADLRRIKGEEAFKLAKYHGVLRDWDREHLSAMLDQLLQHYPDLSGRG